MTDVKTEMLEDARWVDAHALYNFKESQNHDALRQSQRAARNLRAAASLLPSPQPGAVITEEMVERLARFITEECFGYAWEGLGSQGRVTDRGFKPFHYNSFGGKAIQGTQNDMLDIARNAFAALKEG